MTPRKDKEWDVTVSKSGKVVQHLRTGKGLTENDLPWTLHRAGDRMINTVLEIGFDTLFKEQNTDVGGPDVLLADEFQERATG